MLLRLDQLCVVVEVTAGRLPVGGRRRDLKQALDGLLGKAAEQAGRLAVAIAAGSPPAFRDAKTECAVAVDLAGVNRVEAVVVTLDDLGWLANRRDALRELGLLAADDDDVPWVVSVFDLEVIAELTHHPAALTRYISLRHALDRRVLAVDELELWLLYMDEGIDFSTLSASMIMLDGRLARYDDAKLLGRGTLPRLRLQRKRERELERLRSTAAAGWLERAEKVIADTQARRRPTTFPAPNVDGLVVCAPRDRGIVSRGVRDLTVPAPTTS